MKILISGPDFETKHQRGIASYGKSLVKALDELKNEVYLISSHATNIRNKNDNLSYCLDILKNFTKPTHNSGITKLLFRLAQSRIFPIKGKLINNFFYRNSSFFQGNNYLMSVKGFLNIPELYRMLSLHAKLGFKKPVKIDTGSFDIFLSTLPLNIKSNKSKLIQTIHDLIPLETLTVNDDTEVFLRNLRFALSNSDLILCVSNHTKEKCLEYFPNYEEKLKVIYQPALYYKELVRISKHRYVQESVLNEINSKINQGRKKTIPIEVRKSEFLLYIGTLEKRKNIKKLIEAALIAYNRLKLPLVLAGSLGYGKEEFESYLFNENLKKKIIYLGYVNDIEKAVLLRTARAFLFPSLYEGFGIPPLEAMTMETPVLTSNVSALPEVCGNAAYYVDPLKLESIVEGIIEISENSSLRTKLIEEGKKRASFFSMENFKSQLNKILSQIC